MAKADNWWSTDYKYSKQLTIKNLSGDDLATNATLEYQVNTKELYDAGQLQADCEDLRIVYYTGSGNHTEVTRSYYVSGDFTDCSDSTNTTVAFPLSAGLTNGSSTTDYYLYYGNTSATDPGYGDNGYSIGSAEATLVCPFNGTTTCVDGETPSTETGAIRYSGGKGAMSFDGEGDYATVSDFTMPSNFTIEAWAYVNDASTGRHVISGSSNWVYVGNEKGYAFWIHDNKLTFGMSDGSGNYNTGVLVSSSNNTITSGQWVHVAVTKIGADVVLYIDGVNSGSNTFSVSGTNASTTTYVGRYSDSWTDTNVGYGSSYANGLIDEVRISDTARYTDTFTPQTTPFEPDANTKLLLHFDENGDDPRNSGVAIDSSGNGNHGTITGAKYVGGLVGVDSSSSDAGKVLASSYASHQGIFIEEGTTNLITNPSFDHATYNTNWGLNYFNYDSSADTFTPKMAKRNSAGPFAAGVMVQGRWVTSDYVDNITISSNPSVIKDYFYNYQDFNQGSVVVWVTPEWDGDDGKSHEIFVEQSYGRIRLIKRTDNYLDFNIGGKLITVDISDWIAGTTYNVVARWDTKNTLDGTNYISMSINDGHSYSATSSPSPGVGYKLAIGGNGVSNTVSVDAIIEGLTIYRRPLFDGTYGIDVGNGDEIAQIYNSGTGKDPTLITGSWDVVFALPTNASTGELTSGTGNAWSHPHSSNLLYTDTTNTGGFMMNGTYTSDGWADEGTPTSVSALATSEKIFSGGYKVTSSGTANQGIYYDKTVSAGDDWVVRALAHSDGTSIPKIILYDQTNGAEIGSLTGTTSSTRADPDVFIFTGEAPANMTTLRVKLVNTQTTGTTYWHQVEVLDNKVSNPSMEWSGGSVTGWSNYNASNPVTITESTNCLTSTCIDVSYSDAYAFTGLTGNGGSVSTNYFAEGFWYNNNYDRPHNYDYVRASNQHLTISGGNGTVVGDNPLRGQVQRKNTGNTVHIRNQGTPKHSIVDDYFVYELDDVSLTVTPASESNSTESSGLRVDGADTLTQAVSDLSTDRGVIKFKFTPRHSFATADLLGVSSPVIITLYGDADDYLKLLRQDDSTLRVEGSFAGTAVNADYASPTLTAGTTYNIEINYTSGGSLNLIVDGTTQATNTGVVAFTTTPTTAYFGSDDTGSNQYDGTITNFTTLTPTENTTAPYYKFGSKSVKLTHTNGDQADEYTIAIDPNSTSTHTLSAYVYDGTSGNVGGTVDVTIAKLVFGGSVVTPSSYTDMGGGWWRLTYSAATTDASLLYGVQALAGKTIYVDGVQLEAKSYATTYADGTLGTGYSWSGTANESSGVRSEELSKYATSSNIDVDTGSVSMWVKPNATLTSATAYALWQLNGFTLGAYTGVSFQGIYFFSYKGGVFSGGQNNCGATWTVGKWIHAVFTWEGTTMNCYIDSVAADSATRTSPTDSPDTLSIGHYSTNSSHSNSIISDFRIYSSALTAAQVTDLYYTGLSTHSSGTESDDRYQSSGTYISPVIDLSANGDWGATPWSATETLNSGTISYLTRTSADNVDWSDWEAIIGSAIASSPLRYLQWKGTLTPADAPTGGSPLISGADVAYVEDSTAPVNPTDVAEGFSTSAVPAADLTTATWYNYDGPKFTWVAGEDSAAEGQSASGIDGYHVFISTDQDAVPADNTGDDCYLWVEENDREFIVGEDPVACSLSDGTYYLLVQTKDNSGNVATASQMFTYQYDGTIPNAPASVASTNVGYQATNSFEFFWPAATDNGPSGVVGYEYKTAVTTGDYSAWQFTAETSVTTVPAYQEGQNFFYVRTKDNAANYSGATSNDVQIASFYYNESAPTAPQNVTIVPSTTSDAPSSSNVFDVSWEAPASYSGDIAKYFYCVNCTPSRVNMTETTAAQTVNLVLDDMALATQQGKNTFYIVAEDNNTNATTGYGNTNFDAYASVDFYASTTAPGAPQDITITDSSNRDEDDWRLTLVWNVPSSGGTPSLYNVYRSTDNNTFVLLGTTTSLAYTDAGLEEASIYYYKVKAVDDAGSESAASSTVSDAPVGKYTSAPSAGGTPTVTEGSTTATIVWVTGRIAFGTVEYGKTTSYGSAASETASAIDHSIKVTGLAPGTTYHYRVQSLDSSSLVGYERADAYSSDYTFTTLKTAAISNIQVNDVGLESAVISWDTASLATSEVEYGKTLDYGKSISVSTTADESTHSARLTTLEHTQEYHFRVRGTTADGDDIFSEDNMFKTVTFPKITAVLFKTNQDGGGTVATLGWATNVATTGGVEYQAAEIDFDSLSASELSILLARLEESIPSGEVTAKHLKNLDQTYLSTLPIIPKGEAARTYTGELKARHVEKIGGLTDGALYIFTIRGRDEFGNEAISDPIRYITGADTIPPKISNIVVETPITGTGAESRAQTIISWETDEPAYSQILWDAGVGGDYSQKTVKSEDATMKHIVVIRDLQLTSSYHLKITAEDSSENISESKDIVVVTPTPQEAAFDIVLQNLEDVFGFVLR